MNAIEIKNLSKSFRGMYAVDHLNMTVPVGSIYGFWMLYSTGSDQLLISSILYAPGILIFALGKQERHEPTFRFRYESFLAAALVVLAMLSLYLIFNGTLKPF